MTTDELITRTRALVAEERRISTEILHHLRELEKRQVHLVEGFPSMFEFCVHVLGYSEGAAYRRLQTMRLLQHAPELEGKLREGSISMTTAAQLQGYLRKERKMTEAPRLLKEIENKSRLQVEKLLITLSPQSAIPREKERQLTSELTEIRFTVSKELMEKLEKLRSLLSHRVPEAGYADLLNEMADLLLKRLDPESRKKAEGKASAPPAVPPFDEQEAVPRSPQQARPIPAPVRRQVWREAGGRCAYISPATKRRCDSRFQLEVDHIQPLALGGSSSPENLRLLCKQHNLLAATQALGRQKMAQFIPQLQDGISARPMDLNYAQGPPRDKNGL